MTKTGGPAFSNSVGVNGMTLRDWFAGQTISRLGPSESLNKNFLSEPQRTLAMLKDERIAEWCYAQADEMLAARDRKGNS